MIEGIFSSLIATGIMTGFKFREQLWKRFLWNGIFRNQTIRISFASLLKIEFDSKFILIRNINRPESFSPIGGANKYHSSAKSFLNTIEWEDETPKTSAHKKKLQRDLRGFIPAKHLFSFIKWYLSFKDREENSLHREIKEELQEIGLSDILKVLGTPQFSLIRTISEGPYSVSGKSYKQFRLLSVYEFSIDYINETTFITKLLEEIDKSDNLILVNSEEIKQGRAISSECIGSNSEYLNNKKKSRQDSSPWTSRK